ncbi:hypothetical protein Nepgr_003027 [Nepenthes gracilis]|uniref:Uncharacterized protein n=1 Tax=Nepenthes gracilis TaxID=150966 RepID=A0AAD3RYS1_NEPGR|nr:hypothetical protein Nepgr_003027 [Nepenthes gracilis]
MVTSAFKSTTKRTPLGGSSSTDDSSICSNRNSATHRRSRSVSRFSHRISDKQVDYGETTPATQRGKFVNTVRGSAFPEISLDDLAIELFSSSELARRGRSSEVWTAEKTAQRRGRSISRQSSRAGGDRVGGEGRVLSDGSSRRRQSLSAVRCQISDSESDGHSEKYTSHVKHKGFSGGNKQKHLMQKPTASTQQRGLQKCSSQRDLLKSHDDYSSYSSALTDDEAQDVPRVADGIEKTIRAVYAQKKAEYPSGDDVNNNLCEKMRKELRHAVEEIRLELEQVRVNQNPSELVTNRPLKSKNSDVLQAVSTIRSYATKLEQSEKRRKELLAGIMLEEQRDKELKKIVGKLLPDQKEISPVKRPLRARKKSNDRKKLFKQLTEDAEKIIDDFISSMEDTDISSFDGEKSDTSSTFGVTTKPMDVSLQFGETESYRHLAMSDPLPVAMDGVVLPWLQWETGNDGSPIAGREIQRDSLEEVSTARAQERSICSKSSRGSWSPGTVDSSPIVFNDISRAREPDICKTHILSSVPRRSRVDIDDYLKPPTNEDFLLERWKNRERISSGGLLLCNGYLGTVLR